MISLKDKFPSKCYIKRYRSEQITIMSYDSNLLDINESIQQDLAYLWIDVPNFFLRTSIERYVTHNQDR